jgi:hypothetical protein
MGPVIAVPHSNYPYDKILASVQQKPMETAYQHKAIRQSPVRFTGTDNCISPL